MHPFYYPILLFLCYSTRSIVFILYLFNGYIYITITLQVNVNMTIFPKNVRLLQQSHQTLMQRFNTR